MGDATRGDYLRDVACVHYARPLRARVDRRGMASKHVARQIFNIFCARKLFSNSVSHSRDNQRAVRIKKNYKIK